MSLTLEVLGWEPAADEPARSRVEGAGMEDLWTLEVLGWEPAADEPAMLCVEGEDVECLRTLEVLGWEPAADEPARWVGSSLAGAWGSPRVLGLTSWSRPPRASGRDQSSLWTETGTVHWVPGSTPLALHLASGAARMLRGIFPRLGRCPMVVRSSCLVAARVKPAVVSVEHLGPGSGGRTGPWRRNSAAKACRRLPLWTNSAVALPAPVLPARGPSWYSGRMASLGGLGPGTSTGGRGLAIGQVM